MSLDSKTKFLILVPDGMADSPIPELEGGTPLHGRQSIQEAVGIPNGEQGTH